VFAQALPLKVDVHSNNLTAARRSVTECAPIVPQIFARAGKKKGRPLRAALPLSSRDPANSRRIAVFRQSGPPLWEGSSSRVPPIAAIDNETLDHLLSVVDDSRNLAGIRALSKPCGEGDRMRADIRFVMYSSSPRIACP